MDEKGFFRFGLGDVSGGEVEVTSVNGTLEPVHGDGTVIPVFDHGDKKLELLTP